MCKIMKGKTPKFSDKKELKVKANISCKQEISFIASHMHNASYWPNRMKMNTLGKDI